MEEKELKEKELRLIADKLFEEYLNSDEADCLNIKTDNKYSEEDNLRIKKLIYERLDYLEYREEPSFERGVFLCMNLFLKRGIVLGEGLFRLISVIYLYLIHLMKCLIISLEVIQHRLSLRI